MKKKIFIFLSILIVSNTMAQENVNEELLTALQSNAGYKNLALVNGVEYIETYRSINDDHQFLIGRDFYTGTLEYQGQLYKNILLKYDIFRDILVAKLEKGVQGTLILELIKDHVSRFSIGTRSFTNIRDDNSQIPKGFYEIIAEENQVKLLKKHRLNAIEKQDRRMAYYEFEKLDSPYFFEFRNNFIEAGRSSLSEEFPGCKNIVTEKFKTDRSVERKNPDLFWKDLAVSLNLSDCLRTN